MPTNLTSTVLLLSWSNVSNASATFFLISANMGSSSVEGTLADGSAIVYCGRLSDLKYHACAHL